MLTVVRYWVMRSFSTTALIETTWAPLIPRSVFAASWTAASAAFAKLSGDEPISVTTFATSDISAPFPRWRREDKRQEGLAEPRSSPGCDGRCEARTQGAFVAGGYGRD